MRLPEDERRRLAQIFEDMPDLDEQLATLDPSWDLKDKGVDANLDCHNFEIINGTASINLRIFKQWAFLTWSSDLPDYLKLGSDMSSYLRFLEFVLEGLPSKLYDVDDKNKTAGAYGAERKAELRYKKSQEVKDYSLGSEKDRIKLIAEYVTRPESIQSLTIFGKGGSSAYKYPYWLCISFPSSPAYNGFLSIGIPLGESTISGWNGNAMEWVLRTHENRDSLGDLDVSARNLTAQILPVVQKSIPVK